MGAGQNLFNTLQTEAGWLVLVGILIVGIYFAIKRKFTEMWATVAVLVIAVGFVFDTEGVKTIFLNLFKSIFR
ncbi:hypothetical protein [Isobaculum melis]|uniref:Uncharacterized protein n=1 Tax=Isobaculum melis TaxID=142588 RepID=A0A1H9TPL7_9LACT|nr:hypothetical protein [Isobaculum melis]SER99092.1 hypothetical protein SAMN04488559_11545 [Isobaculum melis]